MSKATRSVPTSKAGAHSNYRHTGTVVAQRWSGYCLYAQSLTGHDMYHIKTVCNYQKKKISWEVSGVVVGQKNNRRGRLLKHTNEFMNV
jgi:hypothetical protein